MHFLNFLCLFLLNMLSLCASAHYDKEIIEIIDMFVPNYSYVHRNYEI